ncbi:MAG: NAD-dependent epimerase/dehydratase family protein, partial [Acidobacteriota bacterium]
MSPDPANDRSTAAAADAGATSRVAVTGADGFIGRRFLELYAGHFAHVVGLVRSFPATPVAGVEYRAGDVSLAHSMRFGVRDCDAVVHFAYDHRNRVHSVTAAENVVGACRAAGVRRLVHVSTIAVYDQTVAGTLNEETPAARWRDPYIESKLRIERRLARHWRAGYRAMAIVQPANVYGPGGSWTEHAVRACRAGAVELPRGGAGRCNAVYVDDVAQGVFLALTGTLRDEGIAPPRYLINGPDDVSWADFFAAHGAALAAAGLDTTAAAPTITVSPSDRLFADDPKKDLAMRQAFRPLTARLLFDALALRPPKSSGSSGRDPLDLFWEEPPRSPLRFDGMGRLYLSAPCRASTDRARTDLGYEPAFDLQRGIDEIAAALQPSTPRIIAPPATGASIDLQQTAAPAKLHRRVCVIGTGLAGGALATRLLHHGDELVIVEAGNGGTLTEGEANVGLDNVGLDFGLAIYRDISVGGSGNAWRGLCAPRDAIDYAARDWMPLSGWPIDEAALDAYGHDAAALLHIDDYGMFDDQSTIAE